MTGIIDTNVYLSRWPFRRVYGDEPGELMKKLQGAGVEQAWAGSFEGLFHRDLAAVNARLAAQCREAGQGLLAPFGSINPLLPDWRDDLRRCHEQHQMLGIRLHPNYHGYKLDEPVFAEALQEAARRRLVVQIVALMEDERTQPRLGQAPHVDLSPLPPLLKDFPELRIVALNAHRPARPDLISRLVETGQVWLDIATVESVGGVAKLAQETRLDRIVFGSHFPLYYFESAALKIREAALGQQGEQMVQRENALRLLAEAGAGSD